MDNEVRNTDIPERMQLREVPITHVPEDANELSEEAEWIYKQVSIKNEQFEIVVIKIVLRRHFVNPPYQFKMHI